MCISHTIPKTYEPLYRAKAIEPQRYPKLSPLHGNRFPGKGNAMEEYQMMKEQTEGEFEKFISDLTDTLQTMVGEKASVTSRQVRKNNGVFYSGVMIRERGQNITPVIYPDREFAMYQKNGDIKAAAESVLKLHRELTPAEPIDPVAFTDIGKAGSRIVCRVISREKNAALLKQIPHRDFLDLAIVYYWMTDEEMIYGGTTLIRNEHLVMWGISEEELDDIAGRNTRRLLPYNFLSMQDVLSAYTGSTIADAQMRDFPLYVLSNIEGSYGAWWITDPDVLEHIAGRLKQDFYVLPSSVHECVVLPCSKETDEFQLQNMVREINATQVRPEEVLTDSVYRYSCRSKALSLAAD